jgi:hypothetical protein
MLNFSLRDLELTIAISRNIANLLSVFTFVSHEYTTIILWLSTPDHFTQPVLHVLLPIYLCELFHPYKVCIPTHLTFCGASYPLRPSLCYFILTFAEASFIPYQSVPLVRGRVPKQDFLDIILVLQDLGRGRCGIRGQSGCVDGLEMISQ